MLRAFCDLVSNWLMYADSASDPVLEPEHRGFRPDCVLDRKVPGGVQSKPVKHNSVYSSNQDDYRHNTRFAFTTTEDHYARVVQVEERMNGNSAPEVIVQVEKHGQTIPVLLPENFLIAPQKGDHWLLSAGGVLREDNVLVPKSVQYARTKNDAILRIIGDHLTLSKQSFILFEQSVCMAAEAIPDGFSKHPGVMYKIDAVESRQPRGCSWRAWRIEMVTPEERAALRDMLVDEEIDFGEIAFGTSVTKTVTISNKDGAAHRLTKIALYGCHICRVHPISISEPYFSVGAPHFLYDAIHFHPFRKFDFLLPVNATAHVNVKMAGTEPGQWKFALKFFFEDRKMRSCLFSANVLQSDGSVVDQVRADPEWRLSQDRIRRQVAKEAAIRVREADYEKPKKKYNCKQKRDGGAVHDFRNHYDIPCELMDSLSALPEVDALQEQFPVLKEPLNYDNYADKLHLLLHLEEFAEELGVHERFDKVSDELEQVDGTIFKLGLLDLSEGRPSLMSGDHVFAKTIDKDETTCSFRGRIEEVQLDAVLIKFDVPFSNFFERKRLLDFSFGINRSVYRRLHKTLDISGERLSKRFLFPTESNREQCAERIHDRLQFSQEIKWINPDLNELQRKAVNMVCRGRCGPLAHIIFGPPGTGKTLTIVEIILQIYQRDPDSMILACAPSNSGTDLIGQRIIQAAIVPASALRRILAYRRNVDSVPAELAQCAQNGCTEPPLTDDHRIILTTLQSASFFVEYPRKFSHVIIDEAGFATEPEVLSALSATRVDPAGMQVVLAGDPLQLGPVVTSPYAKGAGLEKSLLSRLLECPSYSHFDGSEHVFCSHLVSKLDVSYRSVAALLKVPSTLFYNAQLTTVVPDENNIFGERLMIPGLTFWPVKSREMREARSPSVYNPGQVAVVMKLLHKLRTVKMSEENIGIIAPYRLQVEQIRRSLIEASLPVPKIGTVDEFQGQEKDAIILSTVRSCHCDPGDSEMSVKAALGFVACPKRINVALTRARFILMIIGDPYVLAMDGYWRRILRYCFAKKCYQTDLLNDNEFTPPACIMKSPGNASRKVPSVESGFGEDSPFSVFE